MKYRSLTCDDEDRRELLRQHDALHGIDYVEVDAAPATAPERVLRVYFLPKKTPAGSAHLAALLDALATSPKAFSVAGGTRVRNVRVTRVVKAHALGRPDHIAVTVAPSGDFSRYTLAIEPKFLPLPFQHALDEPYREADFGFNAHCASETDCATPAASVARARDAPVIDYMAKDYASFRQALLDLIPSIAPAWKERREADVGVAVVELLAYAADQLSYYQDAVANEAFLSTARQRESVRRHARLVDYEMHDGASARAFLCIGVEADGLLKEGKQVLTRIEERLDSSEGSLLPEHGPVLGAAWKDSALARADAVFETMEETRLYTALNEIDIHTWGNQECCLAPGTTAIDLRGDYRGKLSPGSFLLLEEVRGPPTWEAHDANASRRQIVRIQRVEHTLDLLSIDPATNARPCHVTRVSWDRADALRFPLCISTKDPDDNDKPIDRVSVARGNLVLADHGRRVEEAHEGPPEEETAGRERAYRIRLEEGPMSFRIAPPRAHAWTSDEMAGADVASSAAWVPVAHLLRTDPRAAIPRVTMEIDEDLGAREWKAMPDETGARRDLLDCSGSARRFVVETDNEGRALLRFGDGTFGRKPPEARSIKVTYRVGVGLAGNVGAEALAHVVDDGTDSAFPAILSVRNPLPAWGGIEPEPVEDVRKLAPGAFRSEQYRAVTEEDYAAAAEKHPDVSKAVATFRWTGSWRTVFLTIDPKGGALTPTLEESVRAWVESYMQTGYDLEVDGPDDVPLDIEVEVCVAEDHFRADVKEALFLALSTAELSDGSLGFFHPDRFTFGEPLHLSELYAAIQAVEGVASAVVTKFQRHGEVADGEIAQGYIPIGRLEIARLDNDPSAPENGVLRLNMKGGK